MCHCCQNYWFDQRRCYDDTNLIWDFLSIQQQFFCFVYTCLSTYSLCFFRWIPIVYLLFRGCLLLIFKFNIVYIKFNFKKRGFAIMVSFFLFNFFLRTMSASETSWRGSYLLIWLVIFCFLLSLINLEHHICNFNYNNVNITDFQKEDAERDGMIYYWLH